MAKVGGSHERETRSSRIRSVLSEKKSQKPIRQIGTGDVWCERGGAGLAQQFAGHSEKLPAGRTGVDLVTVEPSVGVLNTRLHNSPLLGVDFPLNCETGRSPSSLCQMTVLVLFLSFFVFRMMVVVLFLSLCSE